MCEKFLEVKCSACGARYLDGERHICPQGNDPICLSCKQPFHGENDAAVCRDCEEVLLEQFCEQHPRGSKTLTREQLQLFIQDLVEQEIQAVEESRRRRAAAKKT